MLINKKRGEEACSTLGGLVPEALKKIAEKLRKIEENCGKNCGKLISIFWDLEKNCGQPGTFSKGGYNVVVWNTGWLAIINMGT